MHIGLIVYWPQLVHIRNHFAYFQVNDYFKCIQGICMQKKYVYHEYVTYLVGLSDSMQL